MKSGMHVEKVDNDPTEEKLIYRDESTMHM